MFTIMACLYTPLFDHHITSTSINGSASLCGAYLRVDTIIFNYIHLKYFLSANTYGESNWAPQLVNTHWSISNRTLWCRPCSINVITGVNGPQQQRHRLCSAQRA